MLSEYFETLFDISAYAFLLICATGFLSLTLWLLIKFILLLIHSI